MCGLAGASGEDRLETVQQMLAAISHRGPDGSGLSVTDTFALGHARLSAQESAAGAQPLKDEESRAQVALNGEIYNRVELRKQLRGARFQTRSDAETLLRLEERGGDPAAWLNSLEGMFAFAICRRERLTMGRDPLGIKPLYVGRRGDRMAFASEIKALLDVADRIAEFPPGHYFVSGEGMRRYCPDEAAESDVNCPQEARSGLLRRLVRSIRASLPGGAPAGVLLSGGLDSALVAALAQKFASRMDCFTVGLEGSEDLEHGRRTAEQLGARHHGRAFTLHEAIEALPEVIHHLESFDLVQVRNAIPEYFACKLAAKHVAVALSGEGADELFAGYAHLCGRPVSRVPGELIRLVRRLHHTGLQRCDRMSMAHGLELHLPYLDDPDLVAYALRISPELKVRGGRVTKWILRKAASDFVPRESALRLQQSPAHGAGIAAQLAGFAERMISDSTFQREREIADGVTLLSKEELFYYRMFAGMFPADRMLPLIGRSPTWMAATQAAASGLQ